MSPLIVDFKRVKKLEGTHKFTGQVYSFCNSVISTKLEVDDRKNIICKKIESCLNNLNSTPLEKKNVRKIHSQAVTVIDEIFEGSKELLLVEIFEKLMKESNFKTFRIIMGNFSNNVNEVDAIETLAAYSRPYKSLFGVITGIGTISDGCLNYFTEYIPVFTPHLIKLRDFLVKTGNSALKIKNGKVISKIKAFNMEREEVIEKLEILKKKRIGLPDESFDYLNGTRLAISKDKESIDDLIQKVKKFTFENPMSPTELKRAYINTSTPINSAARDAILGQEEQGISFIRNLSQGIQLSKLMRERAATLENKIVYRYVPSDDLDKILEISKKTYQSLIEVDNDPDAFIGILNKDAPNFKVDAGFTSTTTNRGGRDVTRFGNVELEITLSKGLKVLDIIEECPSQSEILLRKYTRFIFKKAVRSNILGILATIRVGIAG